ncbi:MAG: peptidylprolyl isomerase [FCB group bacterium]|nr:peptidylprolyl isomerase [FCB group bacterium]
MTKKTIMAAALLAAGIIALYGTYQFRQERLTPGRLKAVDLARERVARAEQAEQTAGEKKPEAAPKADIATTDRRPEEPLSLNEVKETPDTFNVQFHTTAGDFVVNFKSEWSPLGVERVYKLVKTGYYDDCIFFRVVPGFVVQWGIASEPAKTMTWLENKLPAEKPKQSNARGRVTFAMSPAGADTRSAQLFINLADNTFLDEMGFGPVGEVVKGMDVVEKLNPKYKEAPTGEQENIMKMGNAFLERQFPGLDRIVWAAVIEDKAPAAPAQGK